MWYINWGQISESVIAYLFLPKVVKPPYQTVIFFPSWGAFIRPGFDPGLYAWDFIIMSGRAFMYPVYRGAFERKIPGGTPYYDKPNAYRDWVIQVSKDLGRSIDYLETRDDIDHGKIAYYGVSMGARLGPIMMAVEDRFKAGIFAIGGFTIHAHILPAADPINFAPRVKVPVLMVNGKEDTSFPLKTSQIPMYEFLGAPDENKTHVLYPGGHGLFGLFIRQIRGDVLGWLDRYLGPVD
jgi:pimeloyl-ACP methyl ester carboxylesterase